MKILKNVTDVKGFIVNLDGTTQPLPTLTTMAIVKSNGTAKKYLAKHCGADVNRVIVTEIVHREQYYEIDDSIFWEYATECEPPRKGRKEEE